MTDGPVWVPPAIGARGTWTRTFTADDVATYAALTGDHNPLHFDAAFAAAVRPGRLIVHGGLTTGLFNALVAEVLPGPGSVFLHQDWDYPAPVYIGDTVTADVLSAGSATSGSTSGAYDPDGPFEDLRVAEVYAPEGITASVAEVIEARADKPITTLRCVARRQDGTEVLRGTSVVYTMRP